MTPTPPNPPASVDELVKRLSQIADWIDEAEQNEDPNFHTIDLGDIDTEVLRESAAALANAYRRGVEDEDALKELADAAEHDMKLNQSDDNESSGGWWSTRCENAIRSARSILAACAPPQQEESK